MAKPVKDERAPGGKVPVTNIRMDLWMTTWVDKAKAQLGTPKQHIYEKAIAEYLVRRGVVPPSDDEIGRRGAPTNTRQRISLIREEVMASMGRKRRKGRG